MDIILVIDDVIYKWTEWPGNICKGYCDFDDACTGSIYKICEAARAVVGSATTHRFKRIN